MNFDILVKPIPVTSIKFFLSDEQKTLKLIIEIHLHFSIILPVTFIPFQKYICFNIELLKG